MAAHPGATKAEARGHGHTPEKPGGGKNQERFADYYERRNAAETHTLRLKQDAFGNLPSWNAEGAAASNLKIPIAQLEMAMPFDSLDAFQDWAEENDIDLDEDFAYYH